MRWLTQWRQSVGGFRRAVRLKEAADRAYKQQDYEAARVFYEASLERFRHKEHWQGVFAVRLALGQLASLQQDFPVARSHFEQSVNLARRFQQPVYRYTAAINLASVAAHQGDIELAERLGRECLDLAETQKSVEWAMSAYSLLGSAASTSAEGRAYYNEALALQREHGAPESIAATLCSLGHHAEAGRDNSEERAHLEQCLEICRNLDNKRLLSYALNNLGNIERYENNLDQAEQLYRDSLALKQEIGDEWAIAYTLEGCAMIAIQRGQAERAARLFGAASGIRVRLGTPLEPSKRAAYAANLAEAQKLLDGTTFQAISEHGKGFSLAQAVAYALSHEG